MLVKQPQSQSISTCEKKSDTTMPEETQKYKCHNCLHIVNASPCPLCNEKDNIYPMCPEDHCNCGHEITTSLAYCKVCGQPVCPICNCHDVSQVSRVTGYLADVGGFNAGKKQELKDRKRYSAIEGMLNG